MVPQPNTEQTEGFTIPPPPGMGPPPGMAPPGMVPPGMGHPPPGMSTQDAVPAPPGVIPPTGMFPPPPGMMASPPPPPGMDTNMMDDSHDLDREEKAKRWDEMRSKEYNEPQKMGAFSAPQK
jgi:hypothetical protein